MFTEELNLIKETEERADALRKSTRAEARQITEEAERKAAKILADAELAAKARHDELVKEGMDLAHSQYDDAIAAAGKQCVELAEKAASAEKDVIGMLVERIVKSSVNY